jgi:hypothetical protein
VADLQYDDSQLVTASSYDTARTRDSTERTQHMRPTTANGLTDDRQQHHRDKKLKIWLFGEPREDPGKTGPGKCLLA